jgi:hypothetical protein
VKPNLEKSTTKKAGEMVQGVSSSPGTAKKKERKKENKRKRKKNNQHKKWLVEWLKWYSTYLPSMRPSVQTPALSKKKKINHHGQVW